MRYIEAQYRYTKKSTVLERSESNIKILIDKISLLKSEIQKVIVGQDVIIEEMLIA